MKFNGFGRAALLAMAATLGACGGGGGGGGAPAAAPDARDGAYTAFAHNGKQYTMTVAINAGTVSYTDGVTTHTSTFIPAGTSTTAFRLQGAGANDGFVAANDALIGSAKFSPSSPSVPFVAARVFATSFADIAGDYNQFLTDKPLGGALNNAINTFTLTAAGSMNACSHTAVSTVAACPPEGRTDYSVSVADSVFTATDGTTTFSFRVAKIGGDKVYLRANTFNDGQERFRIALQDAAGVAPGTFSAIDSQGSLMSYTFDGTMNPGSFAALGTLASGGAASLTGTVQAAFPPLGLRVFTTAADGAYFMQRGTNIGVVIAARNNAVRPGYMMIGVR